MKKKNNRNKKTYRVLISGVGGPAGINAVRLAQAAGFEKVYGVDCDPHASGRLLLGSKYFFAAPRATEAGFIPFLEGLIKKHKIDVFVPTVSEELSLVSSHDFGIPAVVSLKEGVAVANDKLLTHQALEKQHESILPLYRSGEKLGELRGKAERFFLRPRIGRGGRGTFSGSFEEMSAYLDKKDKKEFIVTEFLPGKEYTVDIFAYKDGTVAYAVPRLRLALAGGISIKGKTLRHAAIEKESAKIIASLKLSGPVCIQFKENEKGEFKLVEVNARLSGGAMITAASGANPLAHVLLELQGKQKPFLDWKEKTVLGYIHYQELK